jgi:hypothetical protein
METKTTLHNDIRVKISRHISGTISIRQENPSVIHFKTSSLNIPHKTAGYDKSP